MESKNLLGPLISSPITICLWKKFENVFAVQMKDTDEWSKFVFRFHLKWLITTVELIDFQVNFWFSTQISILIGQMKSFKLSYWLILIVGASLLTSLCVFTYEMTTAKLIMEINPPGWILGNTFHFSTSTHAVILRELLVVTESII